MTTILTVGHGTRSIDAFIDLLRSAGVERLVDVRTAPGSRRHPHFGRDALADSLDGAGISYEWERDLGGFRKPRRDSPNVAIRNPSFRGYADHMETPAFRAARDRLIERADGRTTAIMCAESVWWRCHRRMISDSLVGAGCEVRHLMEGGRQEPHRMTDVARVVGTKLVYDLGQQELSAK